MSETPSSQPAATVGGGPARGVHPLVAAAPAAQPLAARAPDAGRLKAVADARKRINEILYDEARMREQ